jgi:RND family efflux transporter MFP subunit
MLLSLAATAAGCKRQLPPPPPPKTQQVEVSLPVTREVVDYEDFTGRTESLRSVLVRPRVTGYLDRFHFKEGARVKAGDVMFEIDPRPYQAQLDAARAQVAVAEANLKIANAVYARARQAASSGMGTVSALEIEQDRAQQEQAQANLKLAKANLETAQLNFEWTKVRAPISGRTGRNYIDPGNLAKADDTILTTIGTEDDMYANFDMDERTVLRLLRLTREGKIQDVDQVEIPVLMGLADEEGYPHRGKIRIVDNKIDPSAGTLRAWGFFENPDKMFTAGLFVRIRVPVGEPHKALLISEAALGTDQGQKFLFVVNDKDEVEYRPVKVGRLHDGLRVVTDGLREGERVVLNGLQRVRPGAKVEPKLAEMPASKTVAATPSPEPKPEIRSPKLEANPKREAEHPKRRSSGVRR